MLSFYAALLLYSGYFWDCSKRENRYLQVKSAAMTVLYGLRLVLEDAGALFPCQKSLMKAVDALPAEKKPTGIVEKANRFLELMTDEAKEDFVRSVLGFIAYKPPQNLNYRFRALSATMRSGGMTRARLLRNGKRNAAFRTGAGQALGAVRRRFLVFLSAPWGGEHHFAVRTR